MVQTPGQVLVAIRCWWSKPGQVLVAGMHWLPSNCHGEDVLAISSAGKEREKKNEAREGGSKRNMTMMTTKQQQ